MIRNRAAWIGGLGWGQKTAPVRATVVVALAFATMAVAEDAAVKEIPSHSADFVNLLQHRLPDINITAIKSSPIPGLRTVETDNGMTLYVTEDGSHAIAGILITAIESSPIPGLRTVEIDNGMTLHVTEDGSHAIAGVLYALTEDGPVEPWAARRVARRLALLADVSMEQMIVFAPGGETKAVLNVFTDPDCGYCRKLHADVPELNAYGIEVRYLAFPRTGIGSETYDKMVSAWCSDNPRDAMTNLKRGRRIPSKTCDNPVAEHYEIGQRLGVQGTPTIITDDGELIGGYVPAAELAQGLGVQ